MQIGISQPTFLPWPGYFFLISEVDEFIFLDNVQFNKRSWQQRNFLINNDKKLLISIPVKSKGKFDQLINEVEIEKSNFKVSKLLTQIKHFYSKEIYFNQFFYDIENILNKNHKFLIELNLDLIRYFCKIMGINTRINFCSNLNIKNNLHKIDLLSEICLIRGAKSYVSTEGAKIYLDNMRTLPNSITKINYFHQKKENQNISSSILDLIFKNGEKSLGIIRDNFIKTET
jgi:hypothetical protein